MPDSDISYHDTRRGSRIIPLRSYGQPPPEDKFAELDFFDFRLNNYLVPSNDTTYHCQIYKALANYKMKRHAIAVSMTVLFKYSGDDCALNKGSTQIASRA
ncbi:unnamed protein product [Rotaria sp. Silwood2]|nr:unnamed protein product [Rotaria sp. Silwood2]CAF3004557.1 unnamed protein product [Rotaria sp. Silwood2]CAF3139068.1 unnamed protein product [Rotaria sp. Silwood2]CAF3244000.1 unnamed protein product [Rotaria sp. Silwood2]